MKKMTRILLGLVVLQPSIVLLARQHLLTAIPVHYSLFRDGWQTSGGSGLFIALGESVLAPLLILASRRLPDDIFITPLSRWILTPKITWLWWLLGANVLLLFSPFNDGDWLDWTWCIWALAGIGELLAYMVQVAWSSHRFRT